MNTELSTNSIALIALCNEYCHAVEQVSETERSEFVASMLRLLPRLYISASDLQISPDIAEDMFYIEPTLDEDYYDTIRRNIEAVMGEDDTFLEVFEEDMKYSDTPIAASIAEGIADIFQVLYNFIEMIKDAPTQLIQEALAALHDDFNNYWGQTLCNILRPLNHLKHNSND
jgi:hypothetical protein